MMILVVGCLTKFRLFCEVSAGDMGKFSGILLCHLVSEHRHLVSHIFV